MSNGVFIWEEANWGSRSRRLRNNLGMTQLELALKVGVTPCTVSTWECGRRTPNKWLQPVLKQLFDSVPDKDVPDWEDHR